VRENVSTFRYKKTFPSNIKKKEMYDIFIDVDDGRVREQAGHFFLISFRFTLLYFCAVFSPFQICDCVLYEKDTDEDK